MSISKAIVQSAIYLIVMEEMYFTTLKDARGMQLDSLVINFMLCKFIFNPYFYILLTTLIILYYNTKK